MPTRNHPVVAIATTLISIILLGAGAGCGDGEDSPSTPSSGTPVELTPGKGPVAIGPEGGSFELVAGKLTVVAQPATLTDAATIKADEVAVPAGMPSDLTPAASGFEISISDRDVLDAPLTFAMPYDSQAPGTAMVMHYDPATGYHPATVVRRDPARNLIYFEARSFSTYVGARRASLPDSATVTKNGVAFSPKAHGFSIPNVSYPSLLSSCGSCLGMAAVARWHFLRSDDLAAHSPQEQTLLAVLGHAGASTENWTPGVDDPERSPAEVVKTVKSLVALDEPVVLILWITGDEAQAHAVLVYGYDRTQFFTYDPNHPGQPSLLRYSDAGIEPYEGFTSFLPLSIESRAPRVDIDKLIDQAEQGFDASNDFTIDSPAEGEAMTARHGRLTGTVTNAGIEQLSLITAAGAQVIPTGSGTIAADYPVFGGANTMILMGGPKARSRMSYARNGGLLRTVTSDLKKAELFTMIKWTQAVDVDLYVHAPAPAADVAWYKSKLSESGISLDFDSERFGPEAVSLSTLEALSPNSRVVAGSYRVRAHYFDGAGAASGEVLIVINENKGPGAAACRMGFTIPTSNKNNDQPGSTGPDWLDLASVDVASGTITPSPGFTCR